MSPRDILSPFAGETRLHKSKILAVNGNDEIDLSESILSRRNKELARIVWCWESLR
jgi:hypothetical protein